MCGIVGLAAGDFQLRHREAFRNLLLVDTIRGAHGTGMFSVDKRGNEDWLKLAGPASNFVDLKNFESCASLNNTVYAGHNRHATQGRHSTDNAHPFDFKRVIGVHNGTISYPAKGHLDQYQKFDTDSEALYNTINNCLMSGDDPATAVKNTIERLDDGAWALCMYFKKERKLGFIRNKERPLYYCFCEDNTVLAWASEPYMLFLCLLRNNISIDADKENGVRVKQLNEDTLLLFDIPGKTDEKWKAPTRHKIKQKEKKSYTATHHGVWSADDSFSRGPSGVHTHVPFNSRATTEKTTPLKFPNDTKAGHYKPPYKDHTGRVMQRPEVESKLTAGVACAYCDERQPTWGEEILFLTPSPIGSPRYLCETCIHDKQIMEICRAMR